MPPPHIETKHARFRHLVLAVITLALAFGGTLFAVPSALTAHGARLLARREFERAERALLVAARFPVGTARAYAHLSRAALGPRVSDLDAPYPAADFPRSAAYAELSLARGIGRANTPLHSAVLSRLGYVYREMEQHDRAREYFQRHIATYPDDAPWSRFYLAHDSFTRSFTPVEEAYALLEPAPDTVTDPVDREHISVMYALLSRMARYLERYEEAEAHARRAIAEAEGKRTDVELIAHSVLAALAGRERKFDEARAHVERMKELAGQERVRGAHTEMRQMNELMGADRFDCMLASAYRQGQAFAQAIETALAALKKPAEASARSLCLLVLADSYAAQKNDEQALAYYRQYANETIPENMYEVRGLAHAQAQIETLGR